MATASFFVLTSQVVENLCANSAFATGACASFENGLTFTQLLNNLQTLHPLSGWTDVVLEEVLSAGQDRGRFYSARVWDQNTTSYITLYLLNLNMLVAALPSNAKYLPSCSAIWKWWPPSPTVPNV